MTALAEDHIRVRHAQWLLAAFLLCAAVVRAADEGERLHLFGFASDRQGLTVGAASPRSGLVFTDSETPDVRVRLAGADDAATVTYAVEETDGPWRANGTIAFERGAVEKPLPLKLPGRGLFSLALAATCGGLTAKAETRIAVVFTPPKPDPASPWGIFYTPHIWFAKDYRVTPRDLAQSHRLLGASWTRLNFWAHSYDKVTVTNDPKGVVAEYAQWKEIVKALRNEGISIMGTVAQCPRELSSRPSDTAPAGDYGPISNRVKPADYALWEQLMDKLAADFRDDIPVWEIWNEPDIPNAYWTGTPEDFAELAVHTAQALRRGNPNAKIAVAGFTSGATAFADKVLGLGAAKHADFLSIHYTEATRWRPLMQKHKLTTVWNTEEKEEVPLHAFASGIERVFKFIHVNIGYPDFRPLVRKDLTAEPSAVWYSVGAHCIGTAKCFKMDTKVQAIPAFLFRRGEEVIAVLDDTRPRRKLFGIGPASLTLNIKPLAENTPPMRTDRWGRSTPLEINDGKADVPLTGGRIFITGAREVSVDGLRAEQTAAGIIVVEAENGRTSPGWVRSHRAGFSGDRVLDLHADMNPDPAGYWAEVKFAVPKAGKYELLFSGNALSRLKPPRTLSPFVWQIDGGDEHKADDATPIITGIACAPEGSSVLGTIDLAQGEHTFRLRLTARRDQPDTRYALWFDAIALKPIPEQDETAPMTSPTGPDRNESQLEVAPLAPAEYPIASRLMEQSIRTFCSAHYLPEVVEVWIDHNGPDYIAQRSTKQEDYLARIDGEPVAYLGIKRNEIGHLFVDPAWAGRGIGRALVAFSEAAFRERGHTGAFVFASLNAWGFYEKLGYRRPAEGAFEIAPAIRLGYVRMEKVF